MRAMRALGQSLLALDIYVWMTHRMSYLSRRTIIPWISLQGQFGSNYAADEQGMRDSKRACLRELKQSWWSIRKPRSVTQPQDWSCTQVRRMSLLTRKSRDKPSSRSSGSLHNQGSAFGQEPTFGPSSRVRPSAVICTQTIFQSVLLFICA